MKKIYLVGYPRSGNVWLARCLGDMYDCSIVGGENREPISRRLGTNQNIIIIQDHFLATDQPAFVENLTINPRLKTSDSMIIFMYRNPFDVAVSVSKYWGMEKSSTALDVMSKGGKICEADWRAYVLAWIERMDSLDAIVTYEEMRRNPKNVLIYLRNLISCDLRMSISKVVNENSMKRTRERISENPDVYSYNQGIQLGHIRKGAIGDWVNHISREDLGRLWYGEE